MNKPVLYIAGKVSGLPDLNKAKFAAAARVLREHGFIVRNPHEICHGKKEDDWNGCMRECIKTLMECDEVVMLDDWRDSNGARLEWSLAQSVGIKCMPLEAFLNSLKEVKDGVQ